MLQKLDLVKAKLDFHGFSSLKQRNPEKFDYPKIRYTSLWNPMVGKYTKYGEVDTLLRKVDSKFTVFGSGDELSLVFKRPPQEPKAGNTYTRCSS